MKGEKIEMQVVNHNCAGIDVGSRSHFVAIGQGGAHVEEFGVYAEDLRALSKWLLKNKIKSVALESYTIWLQRKKHTNQELSMSFWMKKEDNLH